MKLESMRYCALDVAQDALNSRQVLLARIVHVKAHLLNGVGDIRAREGGVLESPSETPVLSQVSHRRADGGGELRRCVDHVMEDLQAVMPALSKISAAYLACERCMSEESQITAMPRK
jgi:hypothetical protein